MRIFLDILVCAEGFTQDFTVENTLREAIDIAKFVSFEFRNNQLSIKTKARQLHKQNIFPLRATETSRPEQKANTRTATEPTEKTARKMMRKKKKQRQREREKKNIRYMCGKGNLHSGTFHWI